MEFQFNLTNTVLAASGTIIFVTQLMAHLYYNPIASKPFTVPPFPSLNIALLPSPQDFSPHLLTRHSSPRPSHAPRTLRHPFFPLYEAFLPRPPLPSTPIKPGIVFTLARLPRTPAARPASVPVGGGGGGRHQQRPVITMSTITKICAWLGALTVPGTICQYDRYRPVQH
ncbi:hypothetical protein E2C01_034300 [Portunus trituberculatus]|uniref:Uncharacterized protein n=1 Tax=Portunus trituberculatus TaxID=210409 RepID=A0A5B7F861_PORTR|nr:hypothetical protein [Portunus trituberculatus]